MTRKRTISSTRRNELYQQIVPVAETFRKTYLQGVDVIEDTFETLARLDFLFIRFPAVESLSGFYIKKGGYDCIFINSSHTLGRQYFSSWHEVYHAYSGEVGGISLVGEHRSDEIEQKADFFAGCILMPEEKVSEYIKQHFRYSLKYASYIELIKMQNHFRVSYTALLVRLMRLYPSYKNVLGQRMGLGWIKSADKMLKEIKKAECDELLAKPTNDLSVPKKFYKMLHSNLKSDRISESKVETILETLESVKKYNE